VEGSDSSHSSLSYENDDNDGHGHFYCAGGEAAGDCGHRGPGADFQETTPADPLGWPAMTSMTESSPVPLLKMDLLGRVKIPPTRREQLLVEFERSGTSGQMFAELVGVKYQTFATWVQQRKHRRAPADWPTLNPDPFNFIQRNLITGVIIQLGRSR